MGALKCASRFVGTYGGNLASPRLALRMLMIAARTMLSEVRTYVVNLFITRLVRTNRVPLLVLLVSISLGVGSDKRQFGRDLATSVHASRLVCTFADRIKLCHDDPVTHPPTRWEPCLFSNLPLRKQIMSYYHQIEERRNHKLNL